MTLRHVSAAAWAEEHSLAAPVRYGLLEVMAFQRHPEIYALFGADGAALAARETAAPRSPVRRAGTALLIILAVLGAIAPVAAVATMGGDRFEFFRIDAAQSVPIAGVLFVVATVVQLAILVGWAFRGGRFDGLLFGIVAIAVVFSALACFGMPNVSAVDGYDGWAVWYPAVLSCLVVSSVSAIAMLVRRRIRTPDPAVLDAAEPAGAAGAGRIAATATAVSQIRARVAALPAAERAAIVADRDAALATLETRGLIDAVQRERARSGEPGTLFTLDADPGA